MKWRRCFIRWEGRPRLPGSVAADSGFAAAGVRREPAELSAGEGVLLVPPLPLKPAVGEVEEKGLDFGGAHVAGVMGDFAAAQSGVVEENVAAHPVYVGLFGAVGVVFGAQEFTGLVEEFFGHRRLTFGGFCYRMLTSECSVKTVLLFSMQMTKLYKKVAIDVYRRLRGLMQSNP